MTDWRLVRAEPSEAMEAHAKSGHVFASVSWVWRAMLSASELPTDAEIDELCRCMWGENWYWDALYDPNELYRSAKHGRDDDRARMKAFVAAISGGTHGR